MKRVAEEALSEWRERPSRKPLVLRGARQVGKTFLVEHWGASHFPAVVKVDLERERDLHALFSRTDPQSVIEELSLLRSQAIRPGESLLFIDEIQACPAALALLRYFHELVPELHVIAAGSLIDFALREFRHSMPVGRIEFHHLQPLSFSEFLEAVEGPALAEFLTRWSPGQTIGEAVHGRLLGALRRYFFIGGMPEAVNAYAREKDLLEVKRIQTGLIQTVQEDFAKYGPGKLHELMRQSYRHVAANVGRKIKFVNVSREERAAEVRRALDLLALSRVIHPVYHTSANGLPLGAERDDRRLKALFLDIGLTNRICGLDLLETEQLIAVNEGSLAEQFVGQQLLAATPSFEDPQLYYWAREARNANAEVDFVMSRGQDILPVEVKAGKTGSLRSMFQFLMEKKRNRAVRFHAGMPALENVAIPGDVGRSARLLSLPMYLAEQTNRIVAEAFG